MYGCLSALHRACFSIIRLALENNVVNVIVYIILIIFEAFQLCLFYLSIGLKIATEDPDALDYYEDFHSVSSTITLSKLAIDSNFYVLAVVSFFVLALFVLTTAAMVYAKSAPRGTRESSSKLVVWASKVASLLFALVETFLSLTLFLWLLLPYSCSTNNGKTTLNSDSRFTCWTGVHLAVIIINGINLLFHCVYLTVLEMLFTDTSPRSTIPWASTQANNMRFLKHLSKLILALFTVFDGKSEFYNYLFVLEIAVHCFVVYVLLISPPFINRIAGRSVLFLEVYTLATIISMYIFRILDNAPLPIVVIILEAILFIFSGIVVLFKYKYDCYIISVEVTTNRSESFKEYYFYELFRLLDNYGSSSPSTAIDLYGIYANHQLLCRNPACHCAAGVLNRNATAQRLKDDSEREQNGPVPAAEVQYESVANTFRADMTSMFQIRMDRSIDYMQNPDAHPEDKEEDIQTENYKLLINMCSFLIDFEVNNNFGSIPLRMISAYCFREYVGNVFKSVYELLFIEEKQKPSFRDQFLIYKYKKVIGEEISALAKKAAADTAVDVEKITEFENYYEIFRKQAETLSNLANRFWEQLKSKDLDVNGLYEIGSKMGAIYKDMQRNYKAAIAIFPHNFKMYSEFGNFERFIMNNDVIARNYEARAKQILKEQAEQNREGVHNYENNLVDTNSNSRTFICMISGNPNMMGEIVSVNTEITQILGFKPKEIIGQNSGILCPQYISAKHNQIIENFIMRGSSVVLKSRQVITATNSSGFLVMLESYIKLYPSIQEGIRFVGIFRTLEDYGEFFREKETVYLHSDFALVVTSEDGQILGINETCMARMGVPVSAFKSKATGEDAVMISALVKDVDEPETEARLLKEGMDMVFNTKALQISINKENLSKREVRALKTKAGRYKVFVKLSNEAYGDGLIKVKMYKMIILGNEEKETVQKDLLKGELLNVERKEEEKLYSDKEEGKSSVAEDEQTAISDSKLKDLFELKQNMNTKSSTINIPTIKCGVGLVLLLIVISAVVMFVLVIVDHKRRMKGSDITFYSNRRETDVILVNSVAFLINYLAKNPSHQRLYGDVDLFAHAQEFGYRSIYILRGSQDYLNTLDFSYEDTLERLEKGTIVRVTSKGNDETTYSTVSSINTAVTQYSGQASNYFAYTYEYLAGKEGELPDYYFVKENGIGNISLTAREAEIEFRARLNKEVGKYFYYQIIIMVVVGVLVAVFFVVVTPKLINLQREKINVFLLYAQMNRREIDQQMDRCMDYQKSKGFLDYDKVVDPEDSKDSLDSSEEFQSLSRTSPLFKPEAKQLPEIEVPPKKSETESEYVSDSEDSSESVRDENEITIQEHIDSGKLRSKLAINAAGLIVMTFALFCVIVSYFMVTIVKHSFDGDSGSDRRELISQMSETLDVPTYLLVFTLVSMSENRVFLVDGVDSITYYMEKLLDVIRFQQLLTFDSAGYLKKTLNILKRLDSDNFCSAILELYGSIRNKYPAQRGIFSYTMQSKITKDLCTSFGNSLLSRGLLQAYFMMYYNAKKLRDERLIGVSEHDLSSTVDLLVMSQLFLAPASEGLMIQLRGSIDGYLNSSLKFIIVFFVLYLIISTVTYFLFWGCYLRSTELELVKSKGMLKIMPLALIAKLKDLSRENEDSRSHSHHGLAFFRTFEKHY